MSAAIAGAQTPPAATSTLEERMSQADFRASGLDHLTPEQLKYLNGWLQSHGAGSAQVVSPSGQPVFYPDSSGGRVVFDRDSRVQSWNSPSGATGGH